MLEFNEIFAFAATTMVYVGGSLAMLAALAMVAIMQAEEAAGLVPARA